MPVFRVEKVVGSLPGTLVADTIYFVRTGLGFDIYVTDGTGTIAHQLNSAAATADETGPALTYTDGALTRIDYDSGNYKLFSYTSGVLAQIDYVIGGTTIRKALSYNPDGSLAFITQTVL